MTDLVERLRMAGRNGNPDAREAADEIERLRAALMWAKPYVGRLRDTEYIDSVLRGDGKALKDETNEGNGK